MTRKTKNQITIAFLLGLGAGCAFTMPGCASLQKDPFATADAAIALLQCAEPIVSELTRKREAAAKAALDAPAPRPLDPSPYTEEPKPQ